MSGYKKQEVKVSFKSLNPEMTIGDLRKLNKDLGIDPDKASKNMLERIKKR